MHFVALVTLLLLLQYISFTMLVGMARGKTGVSAPAVTGDQMFERAFRVQMNTLEQLAVTLPAMWLCAYYYKPMVAAGLGLLFFLGRLLYRVAYMRDPGSRGPGMIIGFFANIAMIILAAWGVIAQM
jgi:uncharacterized membrane protein YecN with MAPEG domain